jgi:phenylacetate-CoA ligase
MKYLTTGGSTGIPFGFYTTVKNYYIEFAFMYSAWERSGWKNGDLSAMLRGFYIGSEEDFYKYERFNKILYLSNYFLTNKSYPKYKAIFDKYQPQIFQAYPSAITLLSDLIINNNDCGKWNFKVILLGSENIYQWQREKIQKAFPNSKIFAWYGHAEKTIFAPVCEKTDLLHLSPIYGYTEILDTNNKEIGFSEKGELIGTSFWNFATPFIRYKTNDIALKNEFGCKECGRQHQLLTRIEGRIHEFIVSKNNRYISMTAINMHDDIFDKLIQFQFYQDTEGKIIFKYIPKNIFKNSDIESIIERLKPKLGDDFELETKSVNEISRNKSGKFTFLEQKLDIKYKNEYE